MCRPVAPWHFPSATVHSCCFFSAGKAIYLLPARNRTALTRKHSSKAVTLTGNCSDRNVFDQKSDPPLQTRWLGADVSSGIVHRELDAAVAEEASPAAPLSKKVLELDREEHV